MVNLQIISTLRPKEPLPCTRPVSFVNETNSFVLCISCLLVVLMEPGPSYATEVGSVSDPKQEQILSNLVLIKHPCLVRDGSEKRAIAMLGGIAQVEHTFNVGNMRMQLNFRTGRSTNFHNILRH